jgi:hypothetical protein
MVGIDNGESCGKQCSADAAALGVRMDAEGLQIPDGLLRKRLLQGSAGSCESRESARRGQDDSQQSRRHTCLA